MKILFISDTHGFNKDFDKQQFIDVDMVIHAGDATNSSSPALNHNEMLDFIDWYSYLPVKHKLFIAGNHDVAVFFKHYTRAEIEGKGIVYLEHESIEIEGIKIFGSPYTPTYGNWAFMKKREKLQKYWDIIPKNTDILVTHGPPMYMLDLTDEQATGNTVNVGCKSLYNWVRHNEPKYHVYGHIHNNLNFYNSGTLKVNGINTTFINASCVTDRNFGAGLTSKGTKIDYGK